MADDKISPAIWSYLREYRWLEKKQDLVYQAMQ